jgi:uncharacterized damage-inducible protein DinB
LATERSDIAERLLAGWRRHNEILLYLVDHVPREGFAVAPFGSPRQDVARQLAHVIRVRKGWLAYHRTGRRPPRASAKSQRVSRRGLKAGLRSSGAAVAAFARSCLAGKSRPRLFGRDVVRWVLYLISHESQHRGQMLLALKQSGLPLPERVGIAGVWGPWID